MKKVIFTQIVVFFQKQIFEEIKKRCINVFEKTKVTVWEEVKKEAHEAATEAFKVAEDFCSSEKVKEKEEEIIDRILKNVKLPIFLKPFRGLLKRAIQNKVREVAQDLLGKGKEFIA